MAIKEVIKKILKKRGPDKDKQGNLILGVKSVSIGPNIKFKGGNE